jgi:magnesium transporter
MSAAKSSRRKRDVFEIAARHATLDVPVVRPADRAGAVRRSLQERAYECASHIVVCEDGRFAGVLRIEDLLVAPEAQAVGELMDADAPTVHPGIDQEKAAWHAVQSGEAALSVVDKEGRFTGIIPPARLLGVLLQEHDEDIARLGGFMKRSSAARLASVEPVQRRFWHRIPWLLVGLAGAMVAADIIGSFEARLQDKLILAFFIPGIVYLADAVGTQTETVVVRGLSVGVDIRRVLRLELLTGLGIGLALALVATPFVWWRWDDAEVALGVGLSILIACSTASLVALTLPWLLNRGRFDPAFGSGPLATVIQDLLSVLLYFAIIGVVLDW